VPPRVLTPRRPWKGKRVVLGVTGGIAAYKAIQIARDLTRLGAEVDTVLTHGARHFVQPLSFEGVTGRPVLTDLFSAEGAALHIRLGLEADAVCVAPATADFMARAAQGRADDLLTTTLLATRAPVLICPAMNDRMWSHPQTRANAEHLESALGYRIVGPGIGPLAVGEGEGPGRLQEPDDILDHVGRSLGMEAEFRGKRVLVTAGPTREPVDPVRYLGNRSSGRMGYALARAAWRRGAEVVLVSGPSDLADPPGVETIRVETARQMQHAVLSHIGSCNLNLFAAAVADFRPADPRDRKVKRTRDGDSLEIQLEANPDVAAGTREHRLEGSVTVGFALETEDLLENARDKMERKGFDLVVANPANEPGAGFSGDTNQVVLLDPDGGSDELPLLPKDEVAEYILDRVSALWERTSSALPGDPS
jgi:phosphopantothenoylcysteine decarboxylase/phosphopantothenate--cysteine ligase